MTERLASSKMDDSREGTTSMYLKADDGPIPVLEWDNQSIESVLTGEGDTRAQTVFVSISSVYF